jgi:NAD(P)-dependent dehydrogenase (short-subunit alcohol dehydrogenase family)
MTGPADILLTDQVAIITGGGGGIGRACALRLAEFGADVVIADIVPERCEETAERVRERGRRALPVPTDVTDTDQIRRMVAAADAEFGRVDILVNNAGGVSKKAFLDYKERNWRRHIDINLISMFCATAEAAPIMIRGGRGGSIVNVASIEGLRAAPNVAIYAACKAGMINFTKTLALELSGDNIRVNCIAPDHTITPGGRDNRTGPVDASKWRVPTPEEDDKMRRVIPLLREGDDVECADAIVYLSSKMASYVTGVILPVDGGTFAASGWVRATTGIWTQMEGQRPGR